MPQDDSSSKSAINRRRVLQSVGGAGVVAVAGCLGDDDEDADVSFPIDLQLECPANDADRIEWTELIAGVLEDTGYFNTEVETYAFDDYAARVLDPDYADNGYMPFIGLSGTFNPESFCNALHHQDNHGQCCNMNGVGYDELDEMMDSARYGTDVLDDPELRAERYDDVWRELAEYRGSSIIHFMTDEYILNEDLHGFAPYPFPEGVLSYMVHAPQDEQVSWIDRSGSDPDNTDLSDLVEGGTLRYGLEANISSFDPPYSSDTRASTAQFILFEELVATDAQGNVYPWLAESYDMLEMNDIDRSAYEDYMIEVPATEEGAIEWDDVDEVDGRVQIIAVHPEDSRIADEEVRILTPDGASDAVDDDVFGMQWRYNLHEGVEFHNGEELTAQNVVETAERYYLSDVAAQTFDSVLHVREVDEYTVDIYAQIPDAEAERELPGFQIHSTEQTDLPGGELDPLHGNDPIGTGPYVFEEFEDEQYYIATKNDNYWLEEKGLDALEWWDGPADFPAGPVIDEIDMDIIVEDSTRGAALQNDEIDIMRDMPADQIDNYDDDGGFRVHSIESGGYQYFQYPVHDEPWDDPRLREAVNHLVPRQEVVDEIMAGWAQPAWTMLPTLARGTGTADYDALEDEIRPLNEFDSDRAVELIEEVIEDNDYASDV